MNCQDGSDYGIYPENYETREAYDKAIFDAFVMNDIEETENTEVLFVLKETESDDGEK